MIVKGHVVAFKPFKGFMAYEWQIGPVVVQWFYDSMQQPWKVWKRLHVWKDPYWNKY